VRTVSYSDLKDRFTSAIGVDSLLSVEETAFKNSLNDRVKGAWTRAQWPELMSLKEKTVAAITMPLVADKAVQIDNDSDIMDVFAVFDKNPLSDRQAIKLEYNLINGYLILKADSTQSTVFVQGNQVTPSSYGDGSGETSTLPRFLERYLLLATVADWYKADGQLDKALAQEQMAEETLALEIDRVERLEGMNKISVNTYPSYSFGVNILTTT